MQSYTPRVLYVLVFGPGRSTLLCMLPSPQTDMIFSVDQLRLRTNKLVPTSSCNKKPRIKQHHDAGRPVWFGEIGGGQLDASLASSDGDSPCLNKQILST
jgi:hypothetical protein